MLSVVVCGCFELWSCVCVDCVDELLLFVVAKLKGATCGTIGVDLHVADLSYNAYAIDLFSQYYSRFFISTYVISEIAIGQFARSSLLSTSLRRAAATAGNTVYRSPFSVSSCHRGPFDCTRIFFFKQKKCSFNTKYRTK
jgi:hypothetical protein